MFDFYVDIYTFITFGMCLDDVMLSVIKITQIDGIVEVINDINRE